MQWRIYVHFSLEVALVIFMASNLAASLYNYCDCIVLYSRAWTVPQPISTQIGLQRQGALLQK